MSKYTTQLRYICENCIGLESSVGQLQVYDIIKQSAPIIFGFEYPIFDTDYKSVLEPKILMHYYMREIGFETVGLWKLFLQIKLNEIMPYYNQLYNSAKLEFDPLQDTKFTKEYNLKKNDKTNNTKTLDENVNQYKDTTGNSHSNQYTNTQGDNWSKFSDTPQGDINGIVSGDYLTNATNNTINETVNTTADTNYNDNIDDITKRNTTDILLGNFTANDKYLEKLTGKSSGQSFSKLLQEYRETFINIDMMVIKELEPLFMQLW